MPKVLEAVRARAAERATAEHADGRSVDEYSELLETICGAIDDSQPVEQYDGTLGVTQAFVGQHQSAVGQIQWNANLAAIYTNAGNVNAERWCSGTLISRDLFLTAGHCFDQTGGGWERPRTNGTNNIIPSTEIATNMHVNFNFQAAADGTMRTEVSFPIIALLEYRLGGLDFAIVRLGGNPGAQFGRTALATTDAAAGDMCCIIGHPLGLPKRIEAGPALAPSGNLIRYDGIDTMGGNSGSGVLRASDGRIVGVHTNGGCSPASPNGLHANTGMRIAALIAVSPMLRAMTRPLFTTPASDLRQTVRATDTPFTRFASDVRTVRAFDVRGTSPFGDLKSPWSDVKHPATDVPVPWDQGRIWPPGPPGPPMARPFVLATPHHSMAWNGEAPASAELESLEAMLQQTSEVIAQHEQALDALDAQYRELESQYQALGGQVD